MSKIFKDCNANHYCRQIHLDLNDAFMGLGINLVEDRENLTLLTANGVLKVENIISQLGSVQRTSDLYNFLYHSSTNKIMALIEGIWVQIYLMLDMGTPVEKIYEQLQHLPSDVAGPDVDIDLGALKLFEQAYHTLQSTGKPK